METRAKLVKRRLLWSGVATLGVVWGTNLYWTLVSRGVLDAPWVV